MLGIRVAGWVCVLLLLCAASNAEQDRVSLLLLRAHAFAVSDRCDRALELLDEAQALDPTDASVAALRGSCLIRVRRTLDAIEPLETALAASPGDEGIALSLALALWQVGDLDRSRSVLASTRDSDGRALYHLLDGLNRLQEERWAEAAMSLEQSQALGASRETPAVRYYAALAWARCGQRSRAREAANRVLTIAPDSPWAREAERLLDSL